MVESTHLRSIALFLAGSAVTLTVFAVGHWVVSLPWGVALFIGAFAGVYAVVSAWVSFDSVDGSAK